MSLIGCIHFHTVPAAQPGVQMITSREEPSRYKLPDSIRGVWNFYISASTSACLQTCQALRRRQEHVIVKSQMSCWTMSLPEESRLRRHGAVVFAVRNRVIMRVSSQPAVHPPSASHLLSTMQFLQLVSFIAIGFALGSSATGPPYSCSNYHDCKCHDSATGMQNDAATKAACAATGNTYSDVLHHQVGYIPDLYRQIIKADIKVVPQRLWSGMNAPRYSHVMWDGC
jgi:hypothetical protein